MKKILISFFGDTACYGVKNTKGTILVLQEKNQFDKIFVLPTEEKERKAGAELLKDAFQAEKITAPKIEIVFTNIENPTSYAEIFPKATCIFEDIIRKNPETEIFFNASAGTPQLKLFGQLFAEKSNFPIRVLFCHNPKEISEGQDQTGELDLAFLEAHFLSKSIGKLLEASEFLRISEAFDALSKKTLLDEKKDVFKNFSKLFEIYHFWDLFRFQEAEKHWREIADFSKKDERLMVQKAILGKLINAHQAGTKESMWELFFNMQRRFDQGNYIDVVSRFWRIWEGVLDTEIKKTGIDWEKHIQATLQGKPNPTTGDKISYLKKQKIKLFTRIKNKGYANELLDIPQKDKNSNLLKEARNCSIVAHGMKGLTKEKAEKSLEIAAFLLREVFGDSGTNALDPQFLKKITEDIL